MELEKKTTMKLGNNSINSGSCAINMNTFYNTVLGRLKNIQFEAMKRLMLDEVKVVLLEALQRLKVKSLQYKELCKKLRNKEINN